MKAAWEKLGDEVCASESRSLAYLSLVSLPAQKPYLLEMLTALLRKIFVPNTASLDILLSNTGKMEKSKITKDQETSIPF